MLARLSSETCTWSAGVWPGMRRTVPVLASGMPVVSPDSVGAWALLRLK